MSDDRQGAVAVLESLAEQIAAAAPAGWKRAELRAKAYEDASSHSAVRFTPADPDQAAGHDFDVHPSLIAVHKRMPAADGLTIELRVEARGRFHAVLSERLDRSDDGGFRYLLDPASEPPQPDLSRAGPDAGEGGDPAEAVALLHEYGQRLQEALERPDQYEWPQPLQRENREEILDGLALPQDLRALYAVADGDGGRGLFHGFHWLDLESLELVSESDRWWVPRGWRRYVQYPFITDFGPPSSMKRVSDHPAWIPFAANGTGDYLAVDMAPGPQGQPGQVILIGRHHDEGPVYVAGSVTELLRAPVEAFAAGRFERDDDGGLWLNSGDACRYERRYADECRLTVTGRDAGPVRGMHPELRELSVRDAPWVDLAPVRGAPALWKFSIHNCAGLDLSPLQETPVEVLELATDTIELSALRGHPTVGRVSVRSPKPVDLRPLASCPSLYALDLTDAPTADLEGLGQLTGLRYLKMLRSQWRDFLAGQAIPASLAVAELAKEPLQERKLYWSFAKAYEKPRPTIEDALDWAKRLTGNTTDIVTVKGKFKPPSLSL